ncbi:unnamed protein product [Dicrocoelium dendriticum]|nr:unnamed protein product [Dicrocoelium dendriticum]
MSSRRSSESGDSDEYELLLQAERVQLEEVAVRELESAKHKQVAFAVRTNISFDAAVYGGDAPSPNRVISFEAREFLHIKKRFDPYWWIGRRVHIGSPLGFIPSPAKLEIIHGNLYSNFMAAQQNTTESHMNQAANVNSLGHTGKLPTNEGDGTMERNRLRGLFMGGSDQDRKGPPLSANRRRLSDDMLQGEYIGDGYDDAEDLQGGGVNHSTGTALQDGQWAPGAASRRPGQAPGSSAGVKRKVFFKKPDAVVPYEIVPCMRPVVFVGPALKGYEVTDMMQKAIFDAMKKHFDGRIIVSRVSTNISLAKRVGALLHLDKKSVTERGRSRQLVTLLEVQQDLERIFHLASKMQLLLLDCDTVNHPSQISKTCLAPIVIYIKIGSIRVLNRLIKNRGKEQKKNAGVQTAAAEKLLQCQNDAFDFIVDQNTLGAATEALRQYLENYWFATHPITEQTKAERILGTDSGELDSDRPLVPMTPGHPGLSVVTKSALNAGFTSQEISALTGARAAGWATENGVPMENELGLTGAHYGGGSLGSEFNSLQISSHGDRVETTNPHYGYNKDDYRHSLLTEEDERQSLRVTVPDVTSQHTPHRPHLNVGAAQAVAMAALAAGLSPRPRPVHPSLVVSNKQLFHSDAHDNRASAHRGSPGLAMGIGMGLASGAAANFINATLFHSHSLHPDGPIAKKPVSWPSVAAAAAVTVRQPPLKELGIHQVEGSDGTHVYQSRSARQAKQRQTELERVRREAEAKVLALQATVGGRRRRKVREPRPLEHLDGRLQGVNDSLVQGNFLSSEHHRGEGEAQGTGGGSKAPTGYRVKHLDEWEDYNPYESESLFPGGSYPGTGPPVDGMRRACPPDE